MSILTQTHRKEALPFFVAPHKETKYYLLIEADSYVTQFESLRDLLWKLISLVLLAMLAAPAAFAQDRYIADKLFTYMHSWPKQHIRIIGSVDAGEKITYLQTIKSTGYTPGSRQPRP